MRRGQQPADLREGVAKAYDTVREVMRAPGQAPSPTLPAKPRRLRTGLPTKPRPLVKVPPLSPPSWPSQALCTLSSQPSHALQAKPRPMHVALQAKLRPPGQAPPRAPALMAPSAGHPGHRPDHMRCGVAGPRAEGANGRCGWRDPPAAPHGGEAPHPGHGGHVQPAGRDAQPDPPRRTQGPGAQVALGRDAGLRRAPGPSGAALPLCLTPALLASRCPCPPRRLGWGSPRGLLSLICTFLRGLRRLRAIPGLTAALALEGGPWTLGPSSAKSPRRWKAGWAPVFNVLFLSSLSGSVSA